MKHRIFLLAVLSSAAFGQTQVDLRTQSKTVDFANAPSTRPVKTSTGLPATCQVGDLFFRTDATAGSNLQGCSAVNTWSGMGGGASSVTQLTDFRITNTATLVTLSCSSCNYRIGERVFPFNAAASASSLTGTGAASTIFFYIDANGAQIFGFDGTVVNAASLSGLSGVSGITGFPPDSFPIAQCAVSSNQFTSCTDRRAAFARSVIDPGDGILVTQNPSTGRTGVAVNPSYVPVLASANTFTGSNTFERLAAAVNAVSFSATPTFDASLGNHQKITLTGNVTAPVVGNFVAGELVTFMICQDGTGSRTFAWPSNVKGGMTIGSAANSCSLQQFLSPDGTLLYAVAPGVTGLL